MNKQEFLTRLRAELSGLPQIDLDERLNFYSEMIDDRTEDGLWEEDAVAEIGTVEEIVRQITAEIPLGKLVKEKIKPKRALRIWEIVLLVLGSPVWLPILLALFTVAVALYASLWAVILSFYAVVLALFCCGIAGILGTVFYAKIGNFAGAGCALGAGVFGIGLTVLSAIGCVYLTKGFLKLTKMMLFGIKSAFVKKEGSK